MKIKSLLLSIIVLSCLFITNVFAWEYAPDFVIPENPLGTFGALLAIIIAAGLVAAQKKGFLNIKTK